MKATKTEFMVLEGVGSELLDFIGATINFELDGLGCILTTTDEFIIEKFPVSQNIINVFKDYKGYVLIRK